MADPTDKSQTVSNDAATASQSADVTRPPGEITEMPLGELVAASRAALRGESRNDAFAYELFRRAVVVQDGEAWATVVSLYRGIVLSYVQRHPFTAALGEADDVWVNRAFQRFWKAVRPDRFAQFADLAAVLHYLQLCTRSLILDEVRERRSAWVARAEESSGTPTADPSVVGDLSARQLWTEVMASCKDEAERQVAFLSFVRDLKPLEIQKRHSDLFPTLTDVYRVKRNVIKCLRRRGEVRHFSQSARVRANSRANRNPR